MYYQSTTQPLSLGTIGEQKNFVLDLDYNHTALPKYLSPIKVNVSEVKFTKNTFKGYAQSKSLQVKEFALQYVDSIEAKPRFLKLEIADRVAIINSLNNKENKDVNDFLKNKDDAHIITALAVAFDKENFNRLINAEEVHLEMVGVNAYALNIYKNKRMEQIIHFKEGVVFAYKVSYFCWQENEKFQLGIADIVQGNENCPCKTYRSAKRAKKKINYFKF